MMWILAASLLLPLLAASARDKEDAFWAQVRSPDLLLRQMREYGDEGAYGEALLPERSTEKRAITMISRWSPFNNIGKQRSPIRSNFVHPDGSINPQIRGRVQGQPLRWG